MKLFCRRSMTIWGFSRRTRFTSMKISGRVVNVRSFEIWKFGEKSAGKECLAICSEASLNLHEILPRIWTVLSWIVLNFFLMKHQIFSFNIRENFSVRANADRRQGQFGRYRWLFRDRAPRANHDGLQNCRGFTKTMEYGGKFWVL